MCSCVSKTCLPGNAARGSVTFASTAVDRRCHGDRSPTGSQGGFHRHRRKRRSCKDQTPFDTFDMHSADGMFAVLEEKRAPGIIAIYASGVERANARAFAAYIRARAEEATVPVSLMLDHGQNFEQCIKAISYGFTDVMYDGSSFPLEENIENTQAIVRAARAVEVCVEAELGHVGGGSEYQSYGALRKGFTDPDAVEEFVAETGVDLLAVAVGTAHGVYDGEPVIDLDLLRIEN